VKARYPSSDDGAEVKAAGGDEWLAVRGDACHQLHAQVLGVGSLLMQDSD
jgi:hypothetical protein